MTSKAIEAIRAGLVEIACLGHGSEYGNSDGNVMAIDLITLVDTLSADKPVEPCEDALEFAMGLSRIGILDCGDPDCHACPRHREDAVAYVTADRERLLRDAADRTCNICPCGNYCDRRSDGCKYKAAILGREEVK